MIHILFRPSCQDGRKCAQISANNMNKQATEYFRPINYHKINSYQMQTKRNSNSTQFKTWILCWLFSTGIKHPLGTPNFLLAIGQCLVTYEGFRERDSWANIWLSVLHRVSLYTLGSVVYKGPCASQLYKHVPSPPWPATVLLSWSLPYLSETGPWLYLMTPSVQRPLSAALIGQ